MNFMRLLAAASTMGRYFNPMLIGQRAVFRGATPSRRKGINKDDLPSGYPGAKLARKAMQRAIAVKHPRGLRVHGVTC